MPEPRKEGSAIRRKPALPSKTSASNEGPRLLAEVVNSIIASLVESHAEHGSRNEAGGCAKEGPKGSLRGNIESCRKREASG